MSKLKCMAILLALSAGSSSIAGSEQGGIGYAMLASKRLAMATVAIEQKMARCEALAVALDSSELRRLSLPSDQLRTVLSYFNVKANNECLQPEAGNFVLVAEVVSAVEKDSKPLSVQEDVAELVLMGFRREIEFEESYLRLPANVRSQLDIMPALKRPFDLIGTLEVLQQTVN